MLQRPMVDFNNPPIDRRELPKGSMRIDADRQGNYTLTYVHNHHRTILQQYVGFANPQDAFEKAIDLLT